MFFTHTCCFSEVHVSSLIKCFEQIELIFLFFFFFTYIWLEKYFVLHVSFGLAFVEKQKQKAVCIYAKSLQLCPILCDPMDGSPGLLCPWVSPGKNTGVACHSLLQGIFLTQELKPALPHCRRILYRLSCYYRYD